MPIPEPGHASPVAVDPARQQLPVAKTFIWHSAALDPRKPFGKGDLLGGRMAGVSRFQLRLRLDPGAERAAVLLDFPRQQALVLERQRPRVGDLAFCGGQGKCGSVYDGSPMWIAPPILNI